MLPEIIRERTSLEKLKEHAQATFYDMAKVVVDINRGILVIGGKMHADGEEMLLKDGSMQGDLWGANVYVDPMANGERIEYSSLINIRPRQGNRDMEIQNPSVKIQVQEVIKKLLPL